MDKQEQLLQQLLEQNKLLIKATDRTTRAVRAFVRFLFIQLVGITAAFVLNSLATASINPVQCAINRENCEPIYFLQVLAFLVWITAIIWSSVVGWSELELSEIPRDTSFGTTSKGGNSKSISAPDTEASTRMARPVQGVCSNCNFAVDDGAVACKNCNSWLYSG